MTKAIYIYGLWDPRDYQLRYIGKSKDPDYRLKGHIQEARRNGDNTRKGNWIRQLLSENLEPSMKIIEECTEKNWQKIEIDWIADCRKNGLDLTNLTNGGDGVSGRPLTDEHKRKISNFQRGKVVSEETKKRIGEWHKGKIATDKMREVASKTHKGKILSQEHVEAIRQANLGNKHFLGFRHTEQTRQKMSLAHKGRVYPKRDPLSEETKEKIRISNTGRKLSDEAKRKISLSKIGKPRSEETKEKLRRLNLGKKLSEETKRKMSESHRRRNKQK